MQQPEQPPLTPANCDLQDFPFMPLDVARLRDSELASNETPEACWAAVLLWSASWHQVPAASIPDDELWIAKQAGYQLRGKIDKAWAKVRAGALRGWVKCSDGRMYHPVVAEKARDAWLAKQRQRWGTECARIKKHNDRHGTSVPRPTFDEWVSLGCPQGQPLFVPRDNSPTDEGQPPFVPSETHSKREGEGQGQGEGEGNKYSVPNGTGAAAPPALPESSLHDPLLPAQPEKSPEEMTRDELWAVGKSMLAQAGTPAKQCGAIVGKLVKDYGDAIVVEAVRAAVIARPADPLSYIKASCQHAAGQRQHPNKQEVLEQRNRSVAEQWAAGGQHGTV